MRNFNNIQIMASKFIRFNSFGIDCNNISEFEFLCLIYQLDTGRFECTGLSEKSFLNYLMTSGNNNKDNWALDIANNLGYCLVDFIEFIN